MAENLFDQILADAARGEVSDPAALRKLAKIHGAESRAADEVAPRVLHGRFRYVPELGWMEWDERRWEVSPAAEERARQGIREFMDTVEKDLRAQAAELEQQVDALENSILARAPADEVRAADADETGKALRRVLQKHATAQEAKQHETLSTELRAATQQADIWLNLLSESKISNIAKLSRRIEGVLTPADQLDQHPDLLNCHNGVVDLRTGNLKDHDPGLLMTKLAGAAYDPDARSPRWEQALQAVHPGALEWFQVRMGNSLTGHAPDDDSLVVSDGGGENGKTTVMIACSRAAGSYYGLISHRVLIAQPGQHPTELMDLRGLRFALLEETPEEGRLDTHQLKMTVGSPQITARHMRRDSVTFDATHTLWINTNHVPQVDATDHGTWRRLKRMPWPFKFVTHAAEPGTNERDGDRSLRPYIQNGGDVPAAVLAWMVRGAVKWYAQRDRPMQDPAVVAEAGRQWRSSADVGLLFCIEKLAVDPNSFVAADTMRDAFVEFLAAQGKKAWSAQLMNTRLPDAMAEAFGFRPAVTPTVSAKVRQGDVESWPPLGGLQPARPTRPPGARPRMWRGVRFRTPADEVADRLAEAHLSVVPPSSSG